MPGHFLWDTMNRKPPRLSALSRLQVGTGYTLPQSEKCGLCDGTAVVEVAGVTLCEIHESRLVEIAEANAGTSGRRPATWQIRYKAAS
jgi:hypothetical protein